MMSAVAREIDADVPSGEAIARDFTVLVHSEQRRVFHLCRRILQDSDEADSATQDAFLKAYTAWQRQAGILEDPAKWITRIAVNVCLDRLRSRRWQFWRGRSRTGAGEAILGTAPDGRPSPAAQLLAAEIRERIASALGRLTDRQRAVFVLRHYEDKSIEEISSMLRLERGSVKSHLSRALEKMRFELRDLYETGEPPLDR